MYELPVRSSRRGPPPGIILSGSINQNGPRSSGSPDPCPTLWLFLLLFVALIGEIAVSGSTDGVTVCVTT